MPTKKQWYKIPPIEPDALRPLDGDTFAAKMFRKNLAGKYTECTCGWFFRTECPKKCPPVPAISAALESEPPHKLDVMA